MRTFYEEWDKVLNRQPLADDFSWSDFLSIGFSHPVFTSALLAIGANII